MTEPASGTTVTSAQLIQVHATVGFLASYEEQDRNLVIEMSQAMLRDLIEGRGLAPAGDYVGNFCDVFPADQAAEIAEDHVIEWQIGGDPLG